MYRVTVSNNGVSTTIHSPNTSELKLAEGIIKTEINAIDSFDLKIHMNNPGYGKLIPFKTLISVFNTKTGKMEFDGRVLSPSDNMGNNGLVTASYQCEGELGYLHDSQQRHLEFRGTPTELLTSILEYHNSQVEDYKKFEVGSVNVTDPNDFMYLYLSAEQDTFDTIKDKLVSKLGGELRIRKVGGVRYLDYLTKIGEDKNTKIGLAKNLISMSRDIDPTDIITRLTPLGARIESAEEGATDASQARLTIESVNNGTPYIDRFGLVSMFGIQGGSVTWDDVTDASNLLAKGRDYLDTQKVSLNQYKVTAADLSLIGLDMDSFENGNSYPVINPIMGINERLRIIGKSTDINSPQNATITIGDKFKSAYEYQSETNRTTKQVVELENTISRQSRAIGELQTELNTVNSAVDTIETELAEGDIVALNQSVEDLNVAITDLNTAINNIPTYDVATDATDGLLSSIDKGKLDGLENYGLATNTTDGLMPYADKAKMNRITVANSVNLDNLVARVEALERSGA